MDTTHARDINPNDAMSSGERPSTEQTSAMVYGVSVCGFVMVTIRADAPTSLTTQNMVRKIQPEFFMAPCLPATKMLPNKQGL
jgi:hypothetical protein